MKPEDLRPGDWVTWNGLRASVTHTVGTRGQRHRWIVGLAFEGTDVLTQVYVNPDTVLEAG